MTSSNSLKQGYKKSQIQDSIQNAQTFEDLISVSKELLTLDESKQLLLSKLEDIDPNEKTVNKLYFKVIPLDVIFPDDILCKIIQYLSINFMYNKLFAINKHFNDLMNHNSILYQQYIIKLKFCSKIDTLYFSISHPTKSINISHFMENHHYFAVQNKSDIDSNYPFIWYCTRKLHIIPTTIFSTKIHNSDNRGTHNNGIVNILKKIVSNAKSLEINDEFQDIKSDKLWMDWISLDELFHIHSISNALIYSNLLNYNLKYLDLTGSKSHGPKILNNKLSQLNGLLALKIDVNNTLGMIYSNQIQILSFPINLEFLQIENFNYYSTTNNYILNLSQCDKIVAIAFKQVKNRKYILNNDDNPWSFARYLYNNKKSKAADNKYDLLSLAQCIQWPSTSKHAFIGCLLFDNSHYAQSIQSLYKYFDSFTIDLDPKTKDSQFNTNRINVKYIRYIHDFEKEDDDKSEERVENIIYKNREKRYCVVLNWRNNDGLLWRLLLIDKFKNCKDEEFIKDRISMYNKWFELDIAKWIYHLGT